MKLTAKQKENIKSYWPHYVIRFLANGTVEARRPDSRCWGVLYTPTQTKAHLDATNAN